MRLLKKIWKMSPASAFAALRARTLKKETAGWNPIKGGILKGTELLLPPSGTVWREMISGEYDSFIYEELGPDRVRGKIVWDVGAHVGYHSLAFAALGAEVLAFEPNEANSERLLKNVERNRNLAGRIRHSKVALSDTDGEGSFSQSEDLSGPSMGGHLKNAIPPLSKTDYEQNRFRTTTVRTVRADSLLAAGEREPDIMKIDVEGAEELVLQGAARLLAASHPIIVMEVHHILLMFSILKLLSNARYETKVLAASQASPSRCFICARCSASKA